MVRTTYISSGWEFAQKGWDKTIGTVKVPWLPAQVPGHVHLDLMANGVIDDPHKLMNEVGVQWIDQADWTYRTTFCWEQKNDLPKRVLRFDGLDTVCDVFLNDEHIAFHDNMFVPLEIDVSALLKPGANDLRVEFKSAIRIGEARRAEYFESNGLKDTVARFEERAFVRKAQYMYGWDWGPRLVSCGIWQPVALLEFAARVTDVHVSQKHHKNGTVSLSIHTEFDGTGFVPMHQLIGDDEEEWFGDGTYEVKKPTLWEIDEPTRHTIVTALVSEKAAAKLKNKTLGEVLFDAVDVAHKKFGFVDAKLLRQKDKFGESFEFEVNGKKIWARGANWIPDHSFPSLVDRERLRDRLEKSKDMGFNMLRVWGGGLYESEDFYDLCDEIGILVWQDFPFACNYYPDDEPWQAIIREEAAVNIKRIRHHPSLILWCGNNENLEMYENQWGGADVQPPRYYGANHYDHVLPKIVEALDPGRSYIATSPIGTPPEEKVVDAKRRGPNADWYGDQHNWDVWHGRGDWRNYTESNGRFSSEYGFASSCSLYAWRHAAGVNGDRDVRDATVVWHDKTTKGTDTFIGFVELHYPVSATLEDWVYYSQLNQRDALRHGIEHYRRSEFCKGSLIWQLNDCWPVQSWAIMDSEGRYKALGYELRRLYADDLFSFVRKGEKVEIWAINDGTEETEGEVEVTAHDLDTGKVRVTKDFEYSLEPGQREKIGEISVAGLAVPDTLVVCREPFLDGDTDISAWQLLAEPKQARVGTPVDLEISNHAPGVLAIRVTRST